jgi:vacuolar-type H+-ATPase subunit I/STV1
LKSLTEFREAKEAQIELLKEKIDFIEKFNDDFVANKYRKNIEDLKSLVNEKDLEIENNKSKLKAITDLQETSKQENDTFKNQNESTLSEIKRLEQANIKLLSEKQETVNEILNKSFFIAHEVRAPVANLLGLIHLKKENLIDNNEYIRLVEVSVNNLDSIITGGYTNM